MGYEDGGPLLGKTSPRRAAGRRSRRGGGNTISGGATATAHGGPTDRESLLSMGVIVDRSSFDSSDLRPQHRHPGVGAAGKGLGRESSIPTGEDGADGGGNNQRKLRRRRMKWKPRLPKNAARSTSTDQLGHSTDNHNRPPQSGSRADDASTFGGHMSVVSAMSNGTNSTPRLSNQKSSMFGRRRGGSGFTNNKQHSDESSTIVTASVGGVSTNSSSAVLAGKGNGRGGFGWGGGSKKSSPSAPSSSADDGGRWMKLQSVPERQSPVTVQQQQKQLQPPQVRRPDPVGFSPYGDRSYNNDEVTAQGASTTPTKQRQQQQQQQHSPHAMSPPGSTATESTMDESNASSDFGGGGGGFFDGGQPNNVPSLPVSRNRSDGNTICTPDGRPVFADLGLVGGAGQQQQGAGGGGGGLPPLAPSPPRSSPDGSGGARASPVQGRHVSYSPTSSEGGYRKTYQSGNANGGSRPDDGNGMGRGSGAVPPGQVPIGGYDDADDELLRVTSTTDGGGTDNDPSSSSSSRNGSLSLVTNKLGKLAAASGLVVKPEEYVLAGMRPSPPRGGSSDGRGGDGSMRLDDDDGLSPLSASSTNNATTALPNEEGGNSRQLHRGRSKTPAGGGGGGPNKSSDSPRRRSRSRSASAAGPVDVDGGHFTDADRRLRAIHEMGAEHLDHGEYDEAVEVFEEILRGQTERYGPGNARVGTALHNLGIVHLRKRDYDSAIRVCREAVDVRRGALGPDHLDVAVSLAQLGIAHLENNQHRMALIAFREALHIRRKFLGPKHPKIAKILNNIGCSLFELGEMRGAMLAFEETLDIQRSMMRSSPASNRQEGGPSSADQLLLSIGATQCNIGSIKLRLGDFDGSIVALEEALLIQQSVLGDEHATVLNTIDSINFVDEKRNEQDDGFAQMKKSAYDALGLGDDAAAAGCTPVPPMLTRMMNVNVMQGGKKFYQKVEGLALEQMSCTSEISSSPRRSSSRQGGKAPERVEAW